MSRFSRGLRLSRQSWALLRAHGGLMGFPVPIVSDEDLRSAVRTRGSVATA
jgi:hypothetical protein